MLKITCLMFLLFKDNLKIWLGIKLLGHNILALELVPLSSGTEYCCGKVQVQTFFFFKSSLIVGLHFSDWMFIKFFI